MDALRVRVHDGPCALILRRREQLSEERTIKDHWMAATAFVARDYDRPLPPLVMLDRTAESRSRHRRMINQMHHDRPRVVRGRDRNLQRGELSPRELAILRDRYARIDRRR